MPIGTFNYGGKCPKWRIVFSNACVVFAVVVLAVLVLFGVQSVAKEDVVFIIGTAVFLVLMMVLMRWLAVQMERHNEHLEQQMQLWLQDAVQTEGYMICIEHGRQARFEITIKYNGEEKTFVTPTEFPKEFPFANTRGFWVMCDATIPVLYSPKYNQVIFVDLSNCEEIL